jgi:hypothetical protein
LQTAASGDRLAADLAPQRVTLEIVKCTDKEGGFKLIRRRWVIEPTFSWLRRNRHETGYAETLDGAKAKARNVNF